MACRVIGRRTARSVAVAGPPEASAARMVRVGVAVQQERDRLGVTQHGGGV
jgi:hypothetical protein